MDTVEEGMKLILQGLQQRYDLDLQDDNFLDTPERVSRMCEELFAGVKDTDKKVSEILKAAFPCSYDQLIVVKDIEAFSVCPHHFLPVHYKIYVSYLPNGHVVGLSKIARLVTLLARRPVLQEQLTEDISSSLMKIQGCLGAACVVEGLHYCMAMRGVKQSSAKTITSSLKGALLDTGLKQEFLFLSFKKEVEE